MGLEESLAKIGTSLQDGDFSINISFDRLDRQFTDTNRMLLLYSRVEYKAEDFEWSSVIPTVKIPYRDPALGFLVDGVIFSSVGIYSRAPGIVTDVDKRTLKARTVYEPRIDIVNSRNSTVSIGYKRNAVHIIFKRNGKRKVPIGIFLKALSGLPYKIILDKFAYKPQTLINGFPCEIPKGSEDLACTPAYGIESDEEPSVEDCVNMVYSAITPTRGDSKNLHYTTHWKLNRISSYLHNLHFKTRQKYEATLAVGNRAIGTYLDAEIKVPYFKKVVEQGARRGADGRTVVADIEKEVVDYFYFPKGHYITSEDAREIRRYNINTLRVRTTRSFILQEVSPVYFRAKGYKLAVDVPEVEGVAGTIIDDELLAKLNDTKLRYLEVITPEGRKVIHRSGDEVELGDFYSILNHLFTHIYMQQAASTQYEISNRIVVDYNKQVLIEVEQTYSDIASCIAGSTELRNLLDSFPNLPSNRLIQYLRDNQHKEVSQSDITNIMARAITDQTASALIPETPAAMMPVQSGQYARFDSFHTPDSDKAGSVQHLAVMARVNPETGEIEAPYEIVKNGIPTGKIEYITAAKENNKFIVAWDNDLKDTTVIARCNDDLTTIPRDRVDYRDPSPFCDMSVSRMCVPFPGFSQPKRALMATKMNGQAVPVLFPERPMVSTGADTEVPGLYYTGRHILALCDIPVTSGSDGVLELVGYAWKKNMVEYKFIYGDHVFTFSLPFTATDKESLYNYNLNLNGDNKLYGLDDVIFFNQSCDIKHYDFWTRIKQGSVPLINDYTKPALALGVNIRVGYKTYGSCTIDDAIVISDRLITDNVFSSIQIIKYRYKLRTREFYADHNWCVPLHDWVSTEQAVIKVVKFKSDDSDKTSEKEVLCEQSGEVVYCHKDDVTGEAEVWVATLHTAQVGDKTAGRFGDKSVIAKIVPQDMMPYDPDTGESLDIVLNPLGMPSRMNYGQVLEIVLGACMYKQHKIAVCTPFYPNIKDDITELYKSEGLAPKRLFNPVYGKLTERPVMTGIRYIMKLEQMSNLKTSAVGYPMAVDPVFGQPVDSINHNKGQVIGEMESWVLSAAGAHKIMSSFFSMYADDEEGRRTYFKALEACKETEDSPWDESPVLNTKRSSNKNALVTQTVIRMFGNDVDVDTENNRYLLTPLNLKDIPFIHSPEEFSNDYERVKDNEWFKVPLAAPVINPFWICNFPLHIILGTRPLATLVDGKAYLNQHALNDRANCIVPASNLVENERISMLTGIEAVIALVKETTVDEALARLKAMYSSDADTPGISDIEKSVLPSEEDIVSGAEATVLGSEEEMRFLEDLGDLADVPMNVADVMRFLERMKRNNMELTDLIWYEMPIMPRVFRQSNVIGDREQENSFQTQLKGIVSTRSTSQGIYEALKDLIGYGTPKKDDLVSIRGYFFGHGAQAGQHGKVRGSVLSKRVGFSGRVVIVPMEDSTISPFFIGLPWRVVCVELGKVLAIRLRNRCEMIAEQVSSNTAVAKPAVRAITLDEWQAIAESLGEFNSELLHKYFVAASEDELFFIYNHIRFIVRQIVEGDVSKDGLVFIDGEWRDPAELPPGTTIDCAVVICGRQPTLHKKSTRSFFVKLVDGYSMRIHPIVCAGYNADFDGDQMYHVQLYGDDKIEACQKLSIMQDLISEKDGSFTLSLVQDVALGLYCATIYKDNAAVFSGAPGDFHFFDDIEELRTQLEYGDLRYWEAVVYLDKSTESYYCSTAGRILVNSVIPGAMTQIPSSDPHGIIARVLGPEAIGQFKEIMHDNVWTTTGIKPEGRESTTIVESTLIHTYKVNGARASIMAAQALYEIGLVASDVTSTTLSLEDMSSNVDLEEYMEAPRRMVAKLNNLYQLGLISETARKEGAVHAWDSAKKSAQKDILKSLDPNSNIYYMMYSGARGKPDQVMQSIGFIGNISKTAQTDIEYPILKGYGSGLSSFDLMQTRHTARIGVISTQAGTKASGYATRQSVYMTSGLEIKEDDCGIHISVERVEYGRDSLKVRYPDGRVAEIESLLGEFVDSTTEGFDILRSALTRSGYMLNEQVLDLIISSDISRITLLDGEVELLYTVSDAWRRRAVEDLYSYALPFTDGYKITNETVNWIEAHGLKEIIAVPSYVYEDGNLFDREAYLPVDYDTSRYTVTVDGNELSDEALYTLKVSNDTPGFHYFRNLLTPDGLLTIYAVKYLTKKKIRRVFFDNGQVANFSYQISKLFKDTVEGRVSVGLLGLDNDSCITKETIQSIEELQLDYIPVRTGLTCLSCGGICSKCYGKSLSTKKFLNTKDNVGIAASQAMCEPLSQSTLNVAHSGGKRGAGIGLETGRGYYTRMLQGSMTTDRTRSLMERFAPAAGYIKQDPHNRCFVKIIDEDNKEVYSMVVDSEERLNVPDGAYVDYNDTIVSGLPDLKRYDSTDVFDAALKTRYMLMREYDKVFQSLDVSPRNTEALARAQTSICYLTSGAGRNGEGNITRFGSGALSKTKDTGEEASEPTGRYKLTVSNQSQVVVWYTGVAAYSFENVANMILMGLFTPEGLKLNSCIGNLVTGTEVGSTRADFISKSVPDGGTKVHRSAVRTAREAISGRQRSGDFSALLSLGSGNGNEFSAEVEDEIFNRLLLGQPEQQAIPETIPAPTPVEIPFEIETVGVEVVQDEVNGVPENSAPPIFDVEFVSEEEDLTEKMEPEDDPKKQRKSGVGTMGLGETTD